MSVKFRPEFWVDNKGKWHAQVYHELGVIGGGRAVELDESENDLLDTIFGKALVFYETSDQAKKDYKKAKFKKAKK